MKTVGIIGGLGPDTTAIFYLDIVSAFLKLKVSTRPLILIYNVPLPIQIEKESIMEAKDEERCLPFLIDAAKNLEKSGADFLVMPCNSLHVFIEEIRSAVKIPVLSIVEETAKLLEKQNKKKIGLLSTLITIKKKLYKNKFDVCGIEELVPDEQDQSQIGQIIYNLVMGCSTKKDKRNMNRIVQNLADKGAKTIVLACTDLQLLKPQHDHVEILDTMQVLLEATIREMIKK